MPAADLASAVVKELVRRTKIAPEDIDDMIFGQCYPNGEAPAIGRIASLNAWLGTGIPGMQIDRRCGSGLQAVIDAAMRVQTGVADLVVAGGAESMSQAEHYALGLRWGMRGESTPLSDRISRGRITSGGRNYPVPGGMLETAENLRADYNIGREEQDELAVMSHARAIRAQKNGIFEQEIVAIKIPAKGGEKTFAIDEHPRSDVTLESLSQLKPIMLSKDPAATVTAGNASGQNDAAAACIVASRDEADRLGLKPLSRLVAWSAAGVAPNRMGIGPVPSTARALQRTGLTLKDIDLIELNEAFAAQALAVTREWKLTKSDFDRLNVNGSGISLGHPVGATGVRILCTMLRELDRRKARYALETMCIGGGQGLTAIFERV